MIKINLIASIIFAALLSGCTTSYNMRNINTQVTSDVKPVIVRNYTINEKKKVFVGQQLVRRKTTVAIEKKSSYLNAVAEQDINLTFWATIKEGETLRLQKEITYNNEDYYVANRNFFGTTLALLISKEGILQNIRAIPYGNLLSVSDVSLNLSPSEPRMTIVQDSSPSGGAVEVIENYEIIFSGVSDNKMQFVYREYTKDDMARNAFSQELIYPKSVEFIRYKDLKIKVHYVDGESISYTVVED